MKTRKFIIVIITFILVLSSTIVYANASRNNSRFDWFKYGRNSTKYDLASPTMEATTTEPTEDFTEAVITPSEPPVDTTNEIEKIPAPSTNNKVASDPTTELDGKLSTFYQGDVGDCGAVSAIEAIDNSIYGKNLLSTLITVNSDGSYTLNFGAGKQTISKTEANNAPIRGDLDARIIEAGLEKAINVYNSSFAYQSFEVITGFSGNTRKGNTEKTSLMNIMEEKTNSGEGIIAACDFNIADDSKGIIGDGGHSYSIKSVANDTIIVVNPWDTSKDITLSRNWFENSIRYMTYVDSDSKTVDIYWE